MEKKNTNTLDKIEAVSKILGVVAIPIILVIYGNYINESLQDKNLQRDYVQIAVGILQNESSKDDIGLRKWAVSLINENSDIKLDVKTQRKLENGEIKFPDGFEKVYSNTKALNDIYTGASLSNIRKSLDDPNSDINNLDEMGNTKLMAAVNKDNIDLVRMLVEEYNADLNIQNESGWTALDFASDKKEISAYLETKGAKLGKEIRLSGYNGYMIGLLYNKKFNEFKKLLTKNSININSKGGVFKTTYLKNAIAITQDIDVAKFLIEDLGADVNIKDDSGETVLDEVHANNQELKEYLISKGAKSGEDF